jgi:hypothetical protein
MGILSIKLKRGDIDQRIRSFTIGGDHHAGNKTGTNKRDAGAIGSALEYRKK